MPLGRQLPFDFSIRNEYRFDTFVTSAGSRELVDALKNIAGVRDACYYLWGAPGTGKTHLLQAVCHHNPASAYVPLDHIAGLGPGILEGLENLDVVCMDDIGRVAGDRPWEEKLFRLFNAIRAKGNRLVVGAGHPPRALGLRLPDLTSRLGWGLVYRLHELDDAGKARALRLRASGRGLELGDEVLDYLLRRGDRGAASLFALLDDLDRLSLSEKRRITIPFIRDIMGW